MKEVEIDMVFVDHLGLEQVRFGGGRQRPDCPLLLPQAVGSRPGNDWEIRALMWRTPTRCEVHVVPLSSRAWSAVEGWRKKVSSAATASPYAAGGDLMAEARRKADEDLAAEFGICAEPDRVGLSPWECAAAALKDPKLWGEAISILFGGGRHLDEPATRRDLEEMERRLRRG